VLSTCKKAEIALNEKLAPQHAFEMLGASKN
jgi:hypothetical protein